MSQDGMGQGLKCAVQVGSGQDKASRKWEFHQIRQNMTKTDFPMVFLQQPLTTLVKLLWLHREDLTFEHI